MPHSDTALEIDVSETAVEVLKTESSSKEASAESAIEIDAEDLLRQQKVETYAKLEKARRNLDRVVARFKAYSWNKKLPREKAEAINKELLNAHGLLKNKKLLGAFKDLEEIQNELNKVQYSYSQIKGFIKYIKEIKTTD